MLSTTQGVWRTGVSTLCRVARRSSPRWSGIEYGIRGEVALRPLPVYTPPTCTRHYSSQTAGVTLVEVDNSKASGTATTTTPQQTSIEDLLEQIPPAAQDELSNKRPLRASSLLLLLTPSYAQQALDSDLPLKVLEKLRGSRNGSKPLLTNTAVVDKIPSGNGSSEGLAFAFRNRDVRMHASEDGSTDRMELMPYQLQRMPPSAQKPGWLNISFRTKAIPGNRAREYVEAQLPLAKTIFSNGLVSTMIHRVYEPDNAGILTQSRKSESLERYRSDMGSHVDSRLPTLHAPLIPLTPARQIRNIMGNIIRTVSAEPSFSGSGRGAEETQPASEELEQAVTAFFAAVDIQPQPVSVWALIVPSPLPSTHNARTDSTYRLLGSQRDDLRALWTAGNITESVDSVLNHLLPAGARLRKVLSGGGGWGKKAGLLSLDPDDRYSTRELRQDTGWEVDINEDLREQQRQALGEVAKPGESVMFFLAPEGLMGYEDSKTEGNADGMLAVFGSLPSSIDTVPDVSATTPSDGSPAVQYREGFIGALSEEGLALNWVATKGTSTNTKFDVPFSRIEVSGKEQVGATVTTPRKVPFGRREYSTVSTASTVKERRKLKER